eukprot:323046-Chlamydomonas_euryale.AAC.2
MGEGKGSEGSVGGAEKQGGAPAWMYAPTWMYLRIGVDAREMVENDTVYDGPSYFCPVIDTRKAAEDHSCLILNLLSAPLSAHCLPPSHVPGRYLRTDVDARETVEDEYRLILDDLRVLRGEILAGKADDPKGDAIFLPINLSRLLQSAETKFNCRPHRASASALNPVDVVKKVLAGAAGKGRGERQERGGGRTPSPRSAPPHDFVGGVTAAGGVAARWRGRRHQQ